MKKISVIFCLSGILLLCSCGRSPEEISSKEKNKADSISMATPEETRQEAPEAAPSSTNEDISKKTDRDKGITEQTETKTIVPRQEKRDFYDSAYVMISANRKLIKTSNLVFKVTDVEKATLGIEHLVYRYGGFTLKSEITTTVEQSNTLRINQDSVLEVGISNIENNMTIRVPQFLLDTLLIKLSHLWVELDERTVNAEDVTIDFLANDLRAKIHQKTAVNINKAAQQPGNKLDDVVDAERAANEYLENSIQKQIDNMSLQDRVDYATVTLHFYQDEVLYKKRIASYDISDYKASFGSEFVDALAFGWKIILGFVLFLAKGWSVLLISFGIFLMIYYFIKFLTRRSKKTSNPA